jgi:hypothetical protein
MISGLFLIGFVVWMFSALFYAAGHDRPDAVTFWDYFYYVPLAVWWGLIHVMSAVMTLFKRY